MKYSHVSSVGRRTSHAASAVDGPAAWTTVKLPGTVPDRPGGLAGGGASPPSRPEQAGPPPVIADHQSCTKHSGVVRREIVDCRGAATVHYFATDDAGMLRATLMVGDDRRRACLLRPGGRRRAAARQPARPVRHCTR